MQTSELERYSFEKQGLKKMISTTCKKESDVVQVTKKFCSGITENSIIKHFIWQNSNNQAFGTMLWISKV